MTKDEIIEIGATSIYGFVKDALRDFDVPEDAIQGCPELAQAAKVEFKALIASLSEAGLAIVPREPSERMSDQGHAKGVSVSQLWTRISYEEASELRMEYLPAAYRSMIAAAEEPEQ